MLHAAGGGGGVCFLILGEAGLRHPRALFTITTTVVLRSVPFYKIFLPICNTRTLILSIAIAQKPIEVQGYNLNHGRSTPGWSIPYWLGLLNRVLQVNRVLRVCVHAMLSPYPPWFSPSAFRLRLSHRRWRSSARTLTLKQTKPPKARRDLELRYNLNHGSSTPEWSIPYYPTMLGRIRIYTDRKKLVEPIEGRIGCLFWGFHSCREWVWMSPLAWAGRHKYPGSCMRTHHVVPVSLMVYTFRLRLSL